MAPQDTPIKYGAFWIYQLLGMALSGKSKWIQLVRKGLNGSTINDLGGGPEVKSKMDLFFSAGMPFENYFFLEKAS